MMGNKSKLLNILVPLIVLSKNNAIIAAFSYFLTITLANHLGPEQFGIYSHALIAASFASILINFSTDQTAAILHSYSHNSGQIFNNIFFIRIVLTIPVFAILMCLYFDDFELLIFVYCLLIANFNLGFFYEILDRNERYSYIYLLERLAYVGVALLLIHLKLLTLQHLFFLLFVVNATSILYQLIDNKSIVRLNRQISFSKLLNILKENSPLVIIALSTYAYGGFSRLILERQLGAEVLGIYSAGWQLVTIGTIFQAQVSRLWRVPISDSVRAFDSKGLYKAIHSYVLLAMLPMVVVCGIFVFLPDVIVKSLFTDSYVELIDILPILGIYLVVINIVGLMDMLWVALRRSAIYMLMNLIFGAMLLGFLWLFSPSMGMFEFAATTVVFHFLTAVTLAIIWLRTFRFHLIVARAN